MIAGGLITNGLGGNATNLILGQFHLGFISVVIEDGGEDYPERQISGAPLPVDKLKITFTIKRKGKVTKQSYILDKKWKPILINVTNVINTITTKITFHVSFLKKYVRDVLLKVKTK